VFAMIGKLCNGLVAIIVATFASVEMLAPLDGINGLYYGIPEDMLQGSEPAAQFGRHCVAVIGALHFGLAAGLLLSTSASVEVQRVTAIATICAMIMHVAACLRLKAFDGQVVDPLSMPTGALLVCVTFLALGLVVETETTVEERAAAIRTAEQKEFKGDMMENREYVRQLAAARGETAKPTKKQE
jgi:hypothetical protein